MRGDNIALLRGVSGWAAFHLILSRYPFFQLEALKSIMENTFIFQIQLQDCIIDQNHC